MLYVLSSVRYSLGVIPTHKSLALCEKVSASAFCRLVVIFESQTAPCIIIHDSIILSL